MAKRGLTEIEDAILVALEPLRQSHQVRLLAPYGGELEPDQVRRVLAQTPALLLAYDGAEVVEHGSRSMQSMQWAVIVAERHAADLVAARRGDASTPGVYALLDAVVDILEGRQLLPGLLPATALGDRALMLGGGIAAYVAGFQIVQPYLKRH